MNVYFGNLTVTDFEKKTKVFLSEEDKVFLEEHRMDSANQPLTNKLHIFQEPFQIHCGTGIFQEVLKILQKYDYSKSETFALQEYLE
jgi:hypothetical protein